MDALRDLFARMLAERCPAAQPWLVERCAAVAAGQSHALATTVALLPRYCGKADLQPTAAEQEQAAALVPGLRMQHWSVDHLGRLLVVLHLGAASAQAWQVALDALFRTADVAEAVALYQGLACFPHGPQWVARACEGIRSNQKPLFTAVAHNNPYPLAHLNQDQWNQMVLKCLFVDVPLQPIVGLDQRRNTALAAMLCDYARERRAAHRPLNPELWRCAASHASGERALAVLADTLAGDDRRHAAAVVLGLRDHASPSARALLNQHPDLDAWCDQQALNWNTITDLTSALWS